MMVYTDMSKTKTLSLQTDVQQAIGEMVESGAERGLQVAVYHRGVPVVDAVAGVADPASGRPVTSETPFYCYSVCKAAASTLVHMLAERGAFGYETKVAELWPEFGAHGKEGVTVRHVLNHTAGVPGIPLTTTIEDLCDWDKMCSAIAGEELLVGARHQDRLSRLHVRLHRRRDHSPCYGQAHLTGPPRGALGPSGR